MQKTTAFDYCNNYFRIEKIKEIKRELKKCLKEVFIQVLCAPVLAGFVSCLTGSILDWCLGWEMTSIIPAMVVVAISMMVWQGYLLAKDIKKCASLIKIYKKAMHESV